jgi:thiosulfate/3-mercaptopyruvate sulfurtransferase
MMGSVLALALSAAVAMAAPATRSDMLVTADWLSQHLTDANVVIVQVSADRKVYDEGHIPGARFIGLPEIAITRGDIHNELPDVAVLKKVFEGVGISDNSRVILYGDTSVLPATRAYFTLDYMGHGDRTALLDGGLEKWSKEGRKLTKDAPSITAGNFTPHPKPEIVMQFDGAKAASAGHATAPILVDARPASDYTGEKGGHIPTALNLNWQNTQVSKDDQTLKPEPALRAMYEAAGVKGDRPVATYCNSGMQASQSYFTLKYLGYNVQMYDGSMGEWKAKDAPIEK